MYRPAPEDEPRAALPKWLHGIAWKLAAKYFESAWERRVVLHAEPLEVLRSVAGPSLDAQVETPDRLSAIERLELDHREILLAVGSPETLSAYAAQRGMSPGTAVICLRIARTVLSPAAREVATMKRGERTRRAQFVRAKLQAKAARLAEEVCHLVYAAVTLELDHLDRYERAAGRGSPRLADQGRAPAGSARPAFERTSPKMRANTRATTRRG